MTLQNYSGTELMQKLNSDDKFAAEFVNECNRICETLVRVNRFELGDWTIEDLAGEVMVKVISNLEKYDNAYSFNTWYSQICKNTFFKHYNTYKKVNLNEISAVKDEDDAEVSIFDTISSGLDIEDSFVKSQSIAWNELMGAIEDLNTNYKMAIQMCYIKGFSVKRAADEMGVAESTVNNWLARGRKKLKEFCDARHLADELYYEMAA